MRAFEYTKHEQLLVTNGNPNIHLAVKQRKPILHGRNIFKNPTIGKTRFRKAEKIKRDLTLKITGNITNNSAMIFSSIMKGRLITESPNAIENGFHDQACKFGPFSGRRGPEKEKYKKEINSKISLQNQRKERMKAGPHLLNTRTMQETVVNGLLSRTGSANIRVNIAPGFQRTSYFNSPQGNPAQKVNLKILRKAVPDKRLVTRKGKVRRNKVRPYKRKDRREGNNT